MTDRKIIANTKEREEMRVAIVEDERLAEIYIERSLDSYKAGEIYKARVESIVPGICAAFVALGEGRNAFLYLKDASGELKINQDIIVQVSKAARKNKGARVTTRISLPGRYLVVVPGGRESGVSRRISSEAERKRLRKDAKALRGKDFGVIIRTAAEGVAFEALKQDVENLLALWRDIQADAKKNKTSAPRLLYRDPGLLGRILRDEFTGTETEIIVDSQDEFESVKAYMTELCSSDTEPAPTITLYDGVVPLFEYYGLETEIEAALDRKVWLRSGAWLMFEQTEALTVIDVNTGKFVGESNMRKTVLATNIEAAGEIARQLRLRAIGGIIVIDFIDMDFNEDKKLLLHKLNEVFEHDRSKTRVFGVTQLGLVELTRKRSRADLRTMLTCACPSCESSGQVLNHETVALAMKRFLRKIGHANQTQAALVETCPEIAEYIAQIYLADWEKELGRKFFIAPVPLFPWGRFRLETQGVIEKVRRRAEVYKSDGIEVLSV